mgnify:CR=1 FL=1
MGYLSKGSLLTVWLASLLLAPLGAHSQSMASQSEPYGDLFQLSLQELMEIEVEVATKTKTQVSLTPSSVTLFTRQHIQNMGFTTLEQLLNYVPGFNASRDVFSGQGHTITPRGRSSNQNSRDVLILINGQRINEEATGGATQISRYISLGNVKQVEVIRGPGSALYGSNAFLGVVNLVTHNQLNETSFGIGSAGQSQIDGHFSTDVSGWHSSVFATMGHDPGVSYPTNGSGFDSTTTDANNRQQLFVRSQKNGIKLSARFAHMHMSDFYLFGFLSNGINRYQTQSRFLRADYQMINEPNQQLDSYLSITHSQGEALIRVADSSVMAGLNDAGVTTGRDDFLAGFLSESSDLTLGMNWHVTLNEQHSITSGFELRESDLIKQKNQNNYELVDFIDVIVLGNAGTIAFYDEVIETTDSAKLGARTVTGLYAQDEYHWRQNMVSTLGVRFDHYSDFGSSLNPRAALAYELNDRMHFKVMYGEAFRAPSPIELTVKNSPAELGNASLDAEKIRTLELFAGYRATSMQLGITVFENEISDSINQVPLANDPRVTYENSGASRNGGWELEFNYQLNPNLQLISNVTQYEKLNNPSVSSPKTLASFMLNFQREAFNLNLNGLYRSNRQQTLPTVENLGSYWQFNAMSRYRMKPSLELSLGINNLTDENINSVAFSTNMPGGVPNRGRELTINLKWKLP